MKRSLEAEMMDVLGQPRQLLQDDLRNLRVINRYLGNYSNIVTGFSEILGARKAERFSLLDVGTGSGDIPVELARWAHSNRIRAQITALEYEPISVELAAVQTRGTAGISLLRADGAAPPFRSAAFDYVLASQLLHHFSEEQIVALLRTWAPIARRAIVISDLVRHPLAYYGIRLLTTVFTRNTMTRVDAPLSVRRAYTMAEWREILRRADVGPFVLRWAFPFRMLAIVNL